MTTAEKNKERRLRRALYEAGYLLRKGRGKINIDNLGGYMIIDYSINAVVRGSRFDLELDDVEDFAKCYCA